MFLLWKVISGNWPGFIWFEIYLELRPSIFFERFGINPLVKMISNTASKIK